MKAETRDWAVMACDEGEPAVIGCNDARRGSMAGSGPREVKTRPFSRRIGGRSVHPSEAIFHRNVNTECGYVEIWRSEESTVQGGEARQLRQILIQEVSRASERFDSLVRGW